LSATLFCNRVKRSHHADVSAGPREHPVRLAPKTMLRPTIRLGCVVGNSTDGTPGFSSLRRFAPDAGGATSPSAGPACRFANRSPRLIFVAEPFAQRGIVILKRTNDHELSASASRLHSRYRSARRGFLSASSDPAMGFASCRTSGPDQRDNRTGTTPRGSSASGNRFRPLSAHGFDDKSTNEMINGLEMCSLRGGLLRSSATQTLWRSPVHPCRAVAAEFALRRPLPVPTACSRG
jgi:hypothetical protein